MLYFRQSNVLISYSHSVHHVVSCKHVVQDMVIVLTCRQAKLLKIFILNYFQQSKMPNGTWVFECQHGENECQGNKEQACALSLYQNNTSVQVRFISCVMSTLRPPRAGSQVIPMSQNILGCNSP